MTILTDHRCVIGIDAGSTTAKAAAFDLDGREIVTFSAPNPRVAVAHDRQEIEMGALWDAVAGVLRQLTGRLAADGWIVDGVSATGHGNGLYLVDELLRPVRPAIASTDSRAEALPSAVDGQMLERVRLLTGSVPWAAQPAVLLRWLSDYEPEAVRRARWVLTCKDWINTCLTGTATAEISDASGCGLVNLASRAYAPEVFDMLGLSRELLGALPPLHDSDAVIGSVTENAAATTGLPTGTHVVAGCMDCDASPIGAGATGLGDVTIIVGTWAINSVVVRSDVPPPHVTLNSLLPEPGLMLAQEVAPTSTTAMDWFSRVLSGVAPVSSRDLLEAAAHAAPGADGLLFYPFVHGAPEHPGASSVLIGAKASHGYPQVARAVAEGITQYHRRQLEKMCSSGASVSGSPWTLAGGGARNPLWAQMFADIIGHPVRRQLGSELGARGVASLAATGVGWETDRWKIHPDPALVVNPGPDQALYQEQSGRYDRVLAALGTVWTAAVPAGTTTEPSMAGR